MGLHRPDCQLILRCECGNGVDDKQVTSVAEQIERRSAALGLIDRKTTKTVPLVLKRPQTVAQIANVFPLLFKPPAARPRVYVVGHGNWQSQTIGGFAPEAIAPLINEGFRLAGAPAPGTVVSVVGCQLARDLGSPGYGSLAANSVDSFAGKLHKLLEDKGLVVFARVYNVTAYYAGPNAGRKTVRPVKGGDLVHHAPNSKVMFAWEGGVQVRRWWDYGANAPGDEV